MMCITDAIHMCTYHTFQGRIVTLEEKERIESETPTRTRRPVSSEGITCSSTDQNLVQSTTYTCMVLHAQRCLVPVQVISSYSSLH